MELGNLAKNLEKTGCRQSTQEEGVEVGVLIRHRRSTLGQGLIITHAGKVDIRHKTGEKLTKHENTLTKKQEVQNTKS